MDVLSAVDCAESAFADSPMEVEMKKGNLAVEVDGIRKAAEDAHDGEGEKEKEREEEKRKG